jgi:uncharacterized protein (TIGR00299 family) protein
MKIAYLQCASGISGDMMLGALVDAGVPLDAVQGAIDSLGLPSCQLEAAEVRRHGFRATKLRVLHEPEHAHRHLSDITELIDGSHLNQAAATLAKRIFQRIGEAEAWVHGTSIEKVHFHEVGAVDSIADIVGTAVAWDLLGVERLESAPVATGYGTIKIAHGETAIPAPATTELLKGIPIARSEIPFELTTPTGAAILAELATRFGPPPAMTIVATGCGAGDRDLKSQANVLRILVGETSETLIGTDEHEICVLETNLDDVTGEIIGHCVTRLFQAGALDVYTTPIQMKKNRPAVMLTVLCGLADKTALEQIVFFETTTLGIRSRKVTRTRLPRESHAVQTEWGTVEGKIITLPDGTQRFSPEYESCKTAAMAAQLPVRRVMDVAAARFQNNGET